HGAARTWGPPCTYSEEFGRFPPELRTCGRCRLILASTSLRWRCEMARVEQATGLDAGSSAGMRARVVKGGDGFRAEQGSDYRPGISAETVGAKSLWLGIASIA